MLPSRVASGSFISLAKMVIPFHGAGDMQRFTYYFAVSSLIALAAAVAIRSEIHKDDH